MFGHDVRRNACEEAIKRRPGRIVTLRACKSVHVNSPVRASFLGGAQSRLIAVRTQLEGVAAQCIC